MLKLVSTFPSQCLDLVQSLPQSLWVNMWISPAASGRHYFIGALCFLHLSVSSSWEFPEPCGEQLDGDISFRNEGSMVSHFRHTVPLVNLCTSSHVLQEDASLMVVEPETNLWHSRMSLEIISSPWVFSRQQYLICPRSMTYLFLGSLSPQAVSSIACTSWNGP